MCDELEPNLLQINWWGSIESTFPDIYALREYYGKSKNHVLCDTIQPDTSLEPNDRPCGNGSTRLKLTYQSISFRSIVYSRTAAYPLVYALTYAEVPQEHAGPLIAGSNMAGDIFKLLKRARKAEDSEE